MVSENPTLSTIKKVENAFVCHKAISKSYIESTCKLPYYSVRSAINYLLESGKIRRIPSSSKGDLYVRAE